MEIFVLSGLGADKRVFKSVDFGKTKVNFIEWIQPLFNETIEEYSKRLLRQINSHRPILIGLSFGGMMAVEISKQIETEKIIIVSSAKTKTEIPLYFRAIGFLQIQKVIPVALLKKSNFLTNWFFGVKSAEDQRLLKDIFIETDSVFLKWAIDKIVNWQNVVIPKNVTHIHGDSDKILPTLFVNSDFQIKGGGHLMTLTHAEEISKKIKVLLDA